MTIPVNYRLRCGNLSAELEMRYNELRDELDLKYKERVSPSSIAQMTSFAVEDALNRRTSSLVKPYSPLLENYIKILLDQEVPLNDEDKEIIDSEFIRPIMEEAEEIVSGILEKHDKYFSLWALEEINGELDEILVKYEGDYRVKQWHLVNNVKAKEEVVVKRFRVKRDIFFKPIDNAMGEMALSDKLIMLEKMVDYYADGMTTTDYESIVTWLSQINDVPGKTYSKYVAANTISLIIGGIEANEYIVKMIATIKAGERVYATMSRRAISIDIVVPSNNFEQSDKRQEILNEIEKQSYIPMELLDKVGIEYV